MIFLLGNFDTVKKLQEGRDSADIVASWNSDLEAFQRQRKKYLLYP
jgi:uncharacterized protein YbbC (DUF1343 family)